MCLMWLGLYHAEANINGVWLQGEILSWIDSFQNIGFNVRGVVCDNHPSNVSEFGNISAKYRRGEEALGVWINDKPIYQTLLWPLRSHQERLQ